MGLGLFSADALRAIMRALAPLPGLGLRFSASWGLFRGRIGVMS